MIKHQRRELLLDDCSSFYRYKKKPSILKWLTVVATIAATLFFTYSALAIEHRQPERISDTNQLDSATSGQLLLSLPKGSAANQQENASLPQYSNAILLNASADVEINGLIASVTLTQSFINQSDEILHGLYAFPLPENAAVNYLNIQVGRRLIEGTVMEKVQAKKVFEQAKKTGKKASLLQQHRPNLFTNHIANIPPHEQITVTLSYVQQVRYQHGQLSFRFPMTYTPRYHPLRTRDSIEEKKTGNEPSTQPYRLIKPDYLPAVFSFADELIKQSSPWIKNSEDHVSVSERIKQRGHTTNNEHYVKKGNISVSVKLNAGFTLSNIKSVSHNISLQGETALGMAKPSNVIEHLPQSSTPLTLAVGNVQVPMDRDFLLTWQPLPGSVPQVSLFKQTVGEHDYTLAIILPPQMHNIEWEEQNNSLSFPRDITFIIDTSGSMQGPSIIQAKQSLAFALQTLTANDSFNIIAFDSNYQSLFPSTVMATPKHLAIATQFITRIQADGGTEMYQPLSQALSMRPAVEQGKQAIRQVVFITDGAVSNEIELFKLIQQTPQLPRLFTVGIGSAPNGYFMKKAAQFGQGSYTYIADVSEVNEKMSSLLNRISRPVLRDIGVQFQPMHLGAFEQFPKKIPDLYQGEPLMIAFKTSLTPTSVQVMGHLADQAWHQELMIEQQQINKGVSTIWARAKIDDLLDGLVTGRHPETVKNQVITTSLKHQVLSPYTSFIAVETEQEEMNDEAIEENSLSDKNIQQAARNKSKGLSQHLLATTHSVVNSPFPSTSVGWQFQFVLGLMLLCVTLMLSYRKG